MLHHYMFRLMSNKHIQCRSVISRYIPLHVRSAGSSHLLARLVVKTYTTCCEDWGGSAFSPGPSPHPITGPPGSGMGPADRRSERPWIGPGSPRSPEDKPAAHWLGSSQEGLLQQCIILTLDGAKTHVKSTQYSIQGWLPLSFTVCAGSEHSDG